MATPILPYGSQSPYRIQNELPPQSPPPKPKRRWLPTVIISIVSILLIVGAGGVYYLTSLANTIVTEGGSHADVLNMDLRDPEKIDASKFTALGDGRFTILLLGADKAAGLTDTIQVLSIDLVNERSSMVSVPRDLQVQVPGSGSVKVNEVFNIGERGRQGGGQALAKQVVGQVLGTKITNYAQVNFEGLRDIVDALGGITVDVPTAINDPLFPAEKGDGFAPFSIRAGRQSMNGNTALKYARSRQTTSDFDRSLRQQLVIDAIRQKALSAGTLANPIAVTNMLESIGKNLRTDLPVDAMMRVIDVYNRIPTSKKQTAVLDTSNDLGLLTSGKNERGQYVIFPTAGSTNFRAVQRWYRSLNPDPIVEKEAAKIRLSRTNRVQQGQLESFASELRDLGFSVTVKSEPDTSSQAQSLRAGQSLLRMHTDQRLRVTRNYLQTLLNVQASREALTDADFEITYNGTTTNASIPRASVSPATQPSPRATATANGR